MVRKIFTFYITDVLLFKCPVPGPKGQWLLQQFTTQHKSGVENPLSTYCVYLILSSFFTNMAPATQNFTFQDFLYTRKQILISWYSLLIQCVLERQCIYAALLCSALLCLLFVDGWKNARRWINSCHKHTLRLVSVMGECFCCSKGRTWNGSYTAHCPLLNTVLQRGFENNYHVFVGHISKDMKMWKYILVFLFKLKCFHAVGVLSVHKEFWTSLLVLKFAKLFLNQFLFRRLCGKRHTDET